MSAVIVTHNSAAELPGCLAGLVGDDRVEVIVVDSGSTDDTRAVAKAVVGARCVVADGNVGWSRASNLGARQAGGGALAFVNPDARPTASQLVELAEGLDAQVGLVAPCFVHEDGSPQHFYFRLTRPVTGPFLYLNSGQRLDAKLGGHIMKRHLYGMRLPVTDPDHAGAACLVVDAAVFNQLGGFNERMFVFFSDMDLSRRIHASGRKLRVAWDVAVPHRGGGTVSTLSLDRLQLMFQRDYLAYSRVAYGRAGRALTTAAIVGFSGVIPALMAAGRGDRDGVKRSIRRVKAVFDP